MNTREYEYFALSLLEELIPDFPKMKKGESPDFQSESCGLEITRSISSSDGEYDAMIQKYLGKPFSIIPKNLLLKLGFNKEPVALNDSFLFCQRSEDRGELYYFIDKSTNELRLVFVIGKLSHTTELDDTLAKSLQEKLNKLNSNYRVMKKNAVLLIKEKQLDYLIPQVDLDAVISSEFNHCVNTIKKVYAENQMSKYHFDTVFILYLDNLFVIDTDTWKQEIIKISQDQLKNAIDNALENN